MTPKTIRLSPDVIIIHGDAKTIPAISCDAVITDPPYGVQYKHGAGGKLAHLTNRKFISGDDESFDPSWIIEKYDAQKGGAGGRRPIVLWGANHYAHKLPPGQWLCWDKACGKGPHTTFQDAEFAWTNRKTPRNIFHHLWLGLLRSGDAASSKSRRIHPAQKPVELILWLFEVARIGVDAVVFDPYMGSGTTGVACIRTGRRFIGVEIDGEHFETARNRLQHELAQYRLPLQNHEPSTS